MNHTTIAYGLDVAGTILSWPSSLLFGEQAPVPIWTTKYILAMHYEKPNKESARLYTKVQEVKCAERWQLAARIIWAVSIVLPLLDALAWLYKSIAKCDPAVASRYESAERKRQILEKARQFQALGESVREFAGVILLTSCQKEIDECTPSEDLQSMRNQRFKHICTKFADNRPYDAVKRCSEHILGQLQSCYNAAPDKGVLKEEDSGDGDLTANMCRVFSLILSASDLDPSCNWMKAEPECALNTVLGYLKTRYDRFYQLCETSAASFGSETTSPISV